MDGTNEKWEPKQSFSQMKLAPTGTAWVI